MHDSNSWRRDVSQSPAEENRSIAQGWQRLHQSWTEKVFLGDSTRSSKSILRRAVFTFELNLDALNLLVSLGYIPFDLTLRGEPRPMISLKIPTRKTPPPTPAAVLQTLRSCVNRAVEDKDVVGTFLSGGLDSSTVVALMSERDPPPRIVSVCMGFGESSDEFPDASRVAEHYGTEHGEFTLEPMEYLKTLPEIIQAVGFPVLDGYMWFPYQYVANKVTHVVSPIGGDELFYGYANSRRLRRVRQYMTFEMLFNLFGRNRIWAYQTITNRIRPTSLLSLFRGDERRKLMGNNYRDLSSMFEGYFYRGNDFMQEFLDCERETRVPCDYLMLEERIAKALGVTLRIPFTDPELVKLTIGMGHEQNMEGTLGKVLLRKAMAGLLPEWVFKKEKQGFSFPFRSWWSGEFKETIESRLLESEFISETFNVDYIKKIITKRLSLPVLFLLYALDVWVERMA